MKFSKNAIRAIAILLVVLLVLGLLISGISSLVSVGAVSQSQIDALKAQRDEISAQQKELQATIDSLEGQVDTVLSLKVALDTQNELVKQDIELLSEQLDTYNALVGYKAEEVAEAEDATQAQYEIYRARIRAMEEQGSTYVLDILFGSQSLSDFLTRYDDISEVAAYDNRLIEAYIKDSESLAQVKAEYEAMVEEQEANQAEMEQKKADLEAQILAASDMIAYLEENLDIYAAEYEANEAAEQQFQAEIDDLVETLRKQEAARIAAGRAATNIASTGSYIWPCPSCRLVTSVYGWREHPVLGGQRFHAGVDIAADHGASIVAADSGEVVTATYSSSYGNYVVVNHGGGNVTLYAHMSSIAVSAGQTVTQGSTLGYVGSTGYSTGPHLHFEIRVNGSTTDPLGYFSGYTIS